MRIAIQGYEGCFHQIVAEEYFGREVEILPCDTFRRVAEAVKNANPYSVRLHLFYTHTLDRTDYCTTLRYVCDPLGSVIKDSRAVLLRSSDAFLFV